jgi:TorA maturation chaperone TorD
MTGGRWELLRALGAVADSPADARATAAALGLKPASDAEHTDVFVLNCPPYASVYLGPDGALGGEGTDRAAGFWRALGIIPPAEPDHLTALLALYASLGEAAAGARRPATAAALDRTRAALLAEHLQPWLPAYLDAVTDLETPGLTAWAQLTRHAMSAESGSQPHPAQLPLALREAPAPAGPDGRIGDLTAALTTPVRSGIILTRRRLALGAGAAGVGHRIGERRYTLHAMLVQDPAATLDWLGHEAQRWEKQHTSRGPGDAISWWWAARAAGTARFLRDSAAAARAGTPAGAFR